jgi:hypothetical protein
VPDRAVEAGAPEVSERGPATVTLEAAAEAAGRGVLILSVIQECRIRGRIER